jgi:uncharacterized membrane protein YqhA
MLPMLELVDVVMISNLLIVVSIRGYETFVSRMNLEKAIAASDRIMPQPTRRGAGASYH